MDKSTNSGTSYMWMKTRKSQQRENSTNTSVCMLKDLSTLKVIWEAEDGLTFTETTLLSELQSSVTKHNNGILIRPQRPSSQLPNQTCLGTSKDQESQATCKSGTPILHGGKSSDIQATTSSTPITTNVLMSQEEKMLKARMFLYMADTMEPISNGP